MKNRHTGREKLNHILGCAECKTRIKDLLAGHPVKDVLKMAQARGKTEPASESITPPAHVDASAPGTVEAPHEPEHPKPKPAGEVQGV